MNSLQNRCTQFEESKYRFVKMMTLKILLFTFIFATISQNKICACSIYKSTADGKTMVVCNYDTWNTSPKIWFENAKHPNVILQFYLQTNTFIKLFHLIYLQLKTK